MKRLLYILILSAIFYNCSKSDVNTSNENYEPIPLEVSTPSNFPELEYNLANNPVTDAGFELGKKLFYEGRLSANDAIACAFCHEQAFAFTHHGHNLSHGVNGGVGFRNAQPMQNLAYQKEFMWDGSASHLDLQPIIPLTSELEMGETLGNVVNKLAADPEYVTLFSRAFNGEEVSSENMLKALSQFMVMMVSGNSKYDQYVRGENNVQLSALELQGLNVFNNKCTSCHATDLFTDQSYRNTGLPVNPQLQDKGRFNILENPDDLYKFKVPSLRNVEVTYPYMHDGRFTTLDAVLEFYNSGIIDNGGQVDDVLLRQDGTYGITLSNEEKESLKAFLKTLTDNQFLNDDRFAEF